MKGRGSLVLLAVVAVVLLRPWQFHEHHAGPDASERLGGRVVRAVDGDTLEVRLDGGEIETVRVIGMLSRVSRPTLRFPAVVPGVKERVVGLFLSLYQ
jgi:hypothetical protein